MGAQKTGKLKRAAWKLPHQEPPDEFAKADKKGAIACNLGRHLGTVGACLFQSRQYQFECHLAHGHGPGDAFPGQHYRDARNAVKGGNNTFSAADLARIQQGVTALITNAIAKLFHGKMNEAAYACPKQCPWLISGPTVTVQFTSGAGANEKGPWKGVVTIEFSCAADENIHSVTPRGTAGLFGLSAEGNVVSVTKEAWTCKPNKRGWIKVCVSLYGYDGNEKGAKKLLDRYIRQEMNHHLKQFPCDAPCETKTGELTSDPDSYNYSGPAKTAFLCMKRDVWCEEVQGWFNPDLPPPIDQWEGRKYRKRREPRPVAVWPGGGEDSPAEPEWQVTWDLRRRLGGGDVE